MEQVMDVEDAGWENSKVYKRDCGFSVDIDDLVP